MDNINVIFEFAIKIAAPATQIPLNMLTHGIAFWLKARNKKANEDTSNVRAPWSESLSQNVE